MFKKVSPNVHLSPSGGVCLTRVLPSSDGSNGMLLVRDSCKQFSKDYPPLEEFYLQRQIDAGVPLKAVSSAVFDSQKLDAQLEQKITQKISDKQVDSNKE